MRRASRSPGHPCARPQSEEPPNRTASDPAGAAPTAAPPGLEAGGGRYRLGMRIGSGGTGIVYAAECIATGAHVAVKVLHCSWELGAENRHKLRQEAQALGRINHECVVKVYDVLTGAHSTMLIMELVDGLSLRSYLHELSRLGQTMPMLEILQVGLQLASGLSAAHEAGVIHGDVKPENVLLLRAGVPLQPVRLKLVDFGLAKLVDATHSGEKGAAGAQPLGTPRYMAPEQAGGVRTEQADVYSLGVVLYELCAGAPPFRAADRATLLQDHAATPPPSLSPRLPVALRRLLAVMLCKEPARRPNIRQVLQELVAIDGQLSRQARHRDRASFALRFLLGPMALAGVGLFGLTQLRTPRPMLLSSPGHIWVPLHAPPIPDSDHATPHALARLSYTPTPVVLFREPGNSHRSPPERAEKKSARTDHRRLTGLPAAGYVPSPDPEWDALVKLVGHE